MVCDRVPKQRIPDRSRDILDHDPVIAGTSRGTEDLCGRGDVRIEGLLADPCDENGPSPGPLFRLGMGPALGR